MEERPRQVGFAGITPIAHRDRGVVSDNPEHQNRTVNTFSNVTQLVTDCAFGELQPQLDVSELPLRLIELRKQNARVQARDKETIKAPQKS